MSIDILIDKIIKKDNPTVVGLDPKIEYVPQYIKNECYQEFGKNLKGAAQAILRFNYGLIDALQDIVPAVKPQSAYYEMYGVEGIKVLHQTISYAQEKGLYVITDLKRGDIGSTAEAYSAAYLGRTSLEDGFFDTAFPSDGMTVNPYLGIDGIQPFINDCKSYNKSIFILVKTSNPSSGEIQDLLVGTETLYEKVALLVHKWGSQTVGKKGYSNVGAVVGATYPEQAQKLRKLMPNTYFLVPGYGAQGGTAKDVAKCFNKDGLGAIVNSSRGIICAYIKHKFPEQEYALAAREEAIKMKNDIKQNLN